MLNEHPWVHVSVLKFFGISKELASIAYTRTLYEHEHTLEYRYGIHARVYGFKFAFYFARLYVKTEYSVAG